MAVLQDIAAKLGAYLVRPHFTLYFVLGICLAAFAQVLGGRILQENKLYLSGFVMPPVLLMIGLQGRFFCRHFYKEKYRTLVPESPLSRGSFGIPGRDKTFYETITNDIGFSRKVAGYIYALSKPITFTLSGLILAVLYLGTAFK